MKRFGIFHFLLALLASCGGGGGGSGGSVVGNGMIRFHDELYDFSFDYDARLNLVQKSQELVTIDNGRLLGKRRAAVSRVDFEVVKPDAMARADVSWQAITVTGVSGVFRQEQTDAFFKAEYLFRLSASAVLNVRVDAVSEADGIKLIAPIVDTLSFDTQSPVIHEIEWSPKSVKAGETAKLRMRASDNLTGIRGKDAYGNVEVSLEYKCRELLDGNGYVMPTCGELHDVGDGWFELDVPTHPRQRGGDYFLMKLTLWDGAGNPRHMVEQDGFYLTSVGERDTQEKIPAARLHIENASPDTTAPEVADAHFEPATIRAGDSGKLVFKATDDDPAFTVAAFCQQAEHSARYGSRLTYHPVRICGTPRQRVDGAWEIDFTSDRYLPAGDYFLHFVISDAVNNSSKMVGLTLPVSNDGTADVTTPMLLEAKAAQASYRPGDEGTILLRIADDLSGVTSNRQGTYSACHGDLKTVRLDWDDNEGYLRVRLCDSQFRHVEGDWYAYDFQLGDNIPTGEYWMPSIELVDAAGNASYLSFGGPEGRYSYFAQTGDVDTGVPVVRFQVVR